MKNTETNLERVLLNFYKDEMISYLKENPEKFYEAVDLTVCNE